MGTLSTNVSALSHTQPSPFKGTRETIADALREQILSGALASGQPLRQERIARQFGVSAVPVREALRDLGGEGLVDFAPRRGATVCKLSRTEVLEICDMRKALEPLALEKAMPHMRATDLRRAKDILIRADQQTDTDLLANWGQVNWAFHSALYQPADRPQLLSVIQNLHIRFERYLRLHFSALDYRSKGQEEHWAILRCCEQGDTAGAINVLKDHISKANAMLLDYIDGEPVEDHAR